MTKLSLTTEEYLQAARRGVKEAVDDLAMCMDRIRYGVEDLWLTVYWYRTPAILHGPDRSYGTLFTVKLTPTNSSSKPTLVRALVASAVTVIAHDGGSEAVLAEARATGLYDHVALANLLDDLLGKEVTS